MRGITVHPRRAQYLRHADLEDTPTPIQPSETAGNLSLASPSLRGAQHVQLTCTKVQACKYAWDCVLFFGKIALKAIE
jgi:hypothetical protein